MVRERRGKTWEDRHCANSFSQFGQVCVGPSGFPLTLPVQATADSIELTGVVYLLFLREKVLDLTEDL